VLCDALDEQIEDPLGGALGLGLLAVMALRLIAMASARSARTVRAG
jgi:hypothetical protein